jgi:hypothetical protein
MISAGAGSLLNETTRGGTQLSLTDWEAPQNGFDEPQTPTPVMVGPTMTIGVAHQLHLLLFTNMAHQETRRRVASQVLCPILN